MDHGILNVPLSKRGDIDKQIDAHKARQAQEARAKSKADAAETRVQREQAKQAVAALSDERAGQLMAKFGLTRKQLTTKLNGIAHWTPAVILRGI